MSAPTTETSGLLGLSNTLADAAERAGKAIVTVNARQRLSSTGVVWRTGIIVTADHTVERDDEITVTLPDGTTVPAQLAGRDPSTDLAVLKFDNTTLAPAETADVTSLKVGQVTLALGRVGTSGVSASFGVLSALDGAFRTGRGGQIDRFIRPDLTLYPGFSGGPLVDALGRIIGINSSHLARSFGLAIPASTINTTVEQLLTKGRIARGYLGVSMQPVRLSDTVKTAHQLPSNGGLIVVAVETNSPAEQGGLIVGDVLIAIDDASLADTEDVQTLLGPDKVGKPVTIRIIRGGNVATQTVTIGERPQKED